jgi:hypothetical protein
LQHSSLATDNLVKIIAEGGSDTLCLQETFTIQNKIVGIPKNTKFLHPEKEETRQP